MLAVKMQVSRKERLVLTSRNEGWARLCGRLRHPLEDQDLTAFLDSSGALIVPSEAQGGVETQEGNPRMHERLEGGGEGKGKMQGT